MSENTKRFWALLPRQNLNYNSDPDTRIGVLRAGCKSPPAVIQQFDLFGSPRALSVILLLGGRADSGEIPEPTVIVWL